ncbi:uncharacterized protein PgNI_12415 [Pyricularia grisea]|uniref:Mid2 domain-containing protein n=1 Tax=Pyricularia grisea TaxID=148305 RepID=A0A6P8AMJ0_PYRGI|nr:uncharacterized protein PgNI_12415 [Pyricularia grisea]TLD03246.1 hypothetical protein PgNI_12415 [Pyricularia grisea]
MWGYGRQPRNQAELLADLTRRDPGGDLETRSGSSRSSASNAIARAFNRMQRRAPEQDVSEAAIRPSVPVVIPGGFFNPIPGSAANVIIITIPGFKTIPPSGSSSASATPTVSSRSSSPTVTSSTPPIQTAAPPSQPPIQTAAPSSQPPRQTAAPSSEPPTQSGSGSTIPPVISSAQPTPPPTENVPAVSSQLPFSSILSTSNVTAAPSETGGAAASPGREASTDGRSANNGSRQIAILAGAIVGVMLLAGLVAMLCIRKRNKAKDARKSQASALPKHTKAGSISGSISYPVQEGGNSGPWAPPLRKPTNVSSRGAPMAAADWPMGRQSIDRNSMEEGSLDDKQYLAYQNLVGNAEYQITPPPVAAQDRTSRAPGSRDTRYLSASSADPYEQINGRYSEWPPMPPVPNADGGGGAQNEGTVPIGYAQTTEPLPPQQPRTLDQYPQTARINQHYSAVEREMLTVSYHQPGAQRGSISPPSPLFFKLDNQGNLEPESRR